MRFRNILKMNIKPFVLHFLLVVFGTGAIGTSWNSPLLNNTVFVVFLLMLIFHYFMGFLLKNYYSWYLNLLSVSFVFMFNYILYLYENIYSNELQSLIDVISIIHKLPFLYILGWEGMNYPLVVAFLPSVLLWFGLESKVIINNRLQLKNS
ncbi:hypothetical protein GI584_18625 [Gracilibacillus salitolerans]|uniref:Uncharacterized protein n=1 Tax=Gracilibacillus salitolerans TaxID=2663022 RepID=A0A5Q2TP73_9BACI|nr:hypothetical protein [Gracilibacillus salitolerans]QGH35941.1 hypothetical protein GI584_18625 [Gracilibacillus salitolerans]